MKTSFLFRRKAKIYYMVSEMMIDISATMCIISIEPPDNGAPEREEPFI